MIDHLYLGDILVALNK